MLLSIIITRAKRKVDGTWSSIVAIASIFNIPRIMAMVEEGVKFAQSNAINQPIKLKIQFLMSCFFPSVYCSAIRLHLSERRLLLLGELG